MVTLNELLNYEFDNFDWKGDYKSINQDLEYHGEGNLYNHTILVLEQLFQDTEFIALNKNEKKILTLATLLHDVGKKFCTINEEDGRITSRGHSLKGSIETRKLFYLHKLGNNLFGDINFYERENICSLIRYHMLAGNFLKREDYKRNIIAASMEVNLKHLTILSRADSRGRICKVDDNELNIDLFTEAAKELNCFETPYVFENDYHKFAYFKNGENYLNYVPYSKGDDFFVTMLSGLPASGKDTFIKENFDEPVISLDEIRQRLKISPKDTQGKVIQEAKNTAKKYLASKTNFIWNATNLTYQLRTSLIDLFNSYGAQTKIIYIEQPYKSIIERNSERNTYVPINIINRMINKLEVPRAWEASSVEYKINLT